MSVNAFESFVPECQIDLGPTRPTVPNPDGRDQPALTSNGCIAREHDPVDQQGCRFVYARNRQKGTRVLRGAYPPSAPRSAPRAQPGRNPYYLRAAGPRSPTARPLLWWMIDGRWLTVTG